MALFLQKWIPKEKKQFILKLVRGYFWFFCGAILGFFFFISFILILYKQMYAHTVFPGVYVDNKDFGGKSKQQVFDYFKVKNDKIQKSLFTFVLDDNVATLSAADLNFGYNPELLANQAYSVGRASNLLANFSLIVQSYLYGIYLQPSYQYNQDNLITNLDPIRKKIAVQPIDARFTFQDGRMKEFQPSSDGQDIDIEDLKQQVESKTLTLIASSKPQNFTMHIPIKILHPQTSTNEANNYGIKELVGSGSSLFLGSIPNRIYNIALAATRLDGILIKPGDVFSFDKAVGDISTLTGYKQAYVIQNGRTVLGDGGGVCQVSTTLFRAVLNAGLPVVERNPHAYRVGYYEQDQGPGLDAAIYSPSVDFKFKNDTDHYILIKTVIDSNTEKLTFELYGTSDNREVSISKPVITSVSSSPDPLYIDDPTLPKGELKQVDFAVPGANVYFTRTVKKDGKVLIADKFSSNYRPWQAVYMRGTK